MCFRRCHDVQVGAWAGEGDNSLELCSQLLETARVAVVPGSGFGADEHVRLSYAMSIEAIERGLDRIEKALSEME